jgi:hypothetical protein
MARPSARQWPWNWARTYSGDIRSVAADEWVSVTDAARMLGTPPHRVENLIANGHLVAATDPSDDLGTTGASVEQEILWRRETTWWRKARRAVGDTMNWIEVQFEGLDALVSQPRGSGRDVLERAITAAVSEWSGRDFFPTQEHGGRRDTGWLVRRSSSRLLSY